jgi:hypothetical protein
MGIRSFAGREFMAYAFKALNARNKVTEQYFILAREAEKLAEDIYDLQEELAAQRTKYHKLLTLVQEFRMTVHAWPWMNQKVFSAGWRLIKHLGPAPRHVQK